METADRNDAPARGTNLQYRLISGCLMGAAVLACVFYLPPIVWWAVLVVVALLGQSEFYRIANQVGLPVFRWFGMVAGAVLISATFFSAGPGPVAAARMVRWEQLVLLGSALVVFVRQFPQKNNPKPLETIACTLLGIWYVPYLLNFVTRLSFDWADWRVTGTVSATGRALVLYGLVVVKLSDVGAFFVGRTFGRHHLFPRLSPKKTWEGLAGGVLFSLVASLVFWWVGHGRLGALPFAVTDAVCLGLLLPLVGVVGDVFESLLKRAAHAKDSSQTIPGMGGILDVIDSLLFGLPVLYVYVTFVMR